MSFPVASNLKLFIRIRLKSQHLESLYQTFIYLVAQKAQPFGFIFALEPHFHSPASTQSWALFYVVCKTLLIGFFPGTAFVIFLSICRHSHPLYLLPDIILNRCPMPESRQWSSPWILSSQIPSFLRSEMASVFLAPKTVPCTQMRPRTGLIRMSLFLSAFHHRQASCPWLHMSQTCSYLLFSSLLTCDGSAAPQIFPFPTTDTSLEVLPVPGVTSSSGSFFIIPSWFPFLCSQPLYPAWLPQSLGLFTNPPMFICVC